MKDDVDKQAACQMKKLLFFSGLQKTGWNRAGLDCHCVSLS
jgi:hypothetical protein